MERRSAEGCARFLRLSPAKLHQRRIELEILNPDGTLNRPKMDHVPYGPQDRARYDKSGQSIVS